MSELDILLPVYNEGETIVEVLKSLNAHVKTPCHLLICYDHDEDSTLNALQNYSSRIPITSVKNQQQGVLGAIVTGIQQSTAPAIMVFMADDTYNAKIVDDMVNKFHEGCEIVCASRFMPGGIMEGCPWLKSVLVRTASFTLCHLARLPTHDATNGFRLFSRRVFQQFTIETPQGWAFSLELLVKAHRQKWKIGEVPALWYERTQGNSRFRVFKWLPIYLRWYFYAFMR
jgi:glycosyltransferase involved in cell wall biosynthesis